MPRIVPEQSVRMTGKGEARLSPDLVISTSLRLRWWSPKDKSIRLIVPDEKDGPSPDTLKVYKSSAASKSGMISLVSSLTRLGLTLKQVAGNEYEAKIVGPGQIEIYFGRRLYGRDKNKNGSRRS